MDAAEVQRRGLGRSAEGSASSEKTLELQGGIVIGIDCQNVIIFIDGQSQEGRPRIARRRAALRGKEDLPARHPQELHFQIQDIARTLEL